MHNYLSFIYLSTKSNHPYSSSSTSPYIILCLYRLPILFQLNLNNTLTKWVLVTVTGDQWPVVGGEESIDTQLGA